MLPELTRRPFVVARVVSPFGEVLPVLVAARAARLSAGTVRAFEDDVAVADARRSAPHKELVSCWRP